MVIIVDVRSRRFKGPEPHTCIIRLGLGGRVIAHFNIALLDNGLSSIYWIIFFYHLPNGPDHQIDLALQPNIDIFN